MSNQPPIEVPQGAIRLNTDSQRLEFFAQDRWYEFATDSPTLDGGGRGLFAGGLIPLVVLMMYRFFNYDSNVREIQRRFWRFNSQIKTRGCWNVHQELVRFCYGGYRS